MTASPPTIAARISSPARPDRFVLAWATTGPSNWYRICGSPRTSPTPFEEPSSESMLAGLAGSFKCARPRDPAHERHSFEKRSRPRDPAQEWHSFEDGKHNFIVSRDALSLSTVIRSVLYDIAT